MTPNLRGRVLALVLLPLFLLLGGCVKLDTAIVISSRDTVDMTMLLAIQDEYAATVDSFCEGGGGATVTSYAADGYVGCIREVEGEALAGLSDPNLDLSIARTDTGYSFVMASTDLGAATGEDSQLAAALFTDFKVAVTFPGEVTAHNGSSALDGTTVTWTDPSDLLSGEGLRATADEASSLRPLLGLLPWLGAGLLVAAGVVIGLLLLNRSRSAQQPVAGTPQWSRPPQLGAGSPPSSGAYPPAPGYPPPSYPQTGGWARPQAQPREFGDYSDPSHLDSPQPPPEVPPRNPWGPPA